MVHDLVALAPRARRSRPRSDGTPRGARRRAPRRRSSSARTRSRRAPSTPHRRTVSEDESCSSNSSSNDSSEELPHVILLTPGEGTAGARAGGGRNGRHHPEHLAEPALRRPARKREAATRLRDPRELACDGRVVGCEHHAARRHDDVEARVVVRASSSASPTSNWTVTSSSAARSRAVSMRTGRDPVRRPPRRAWRRGSRPRRYRSRRRARVRPASDRFARSQASWMSRIVFVMRSYGPLPQMTLCRAFSSANAIAPPRVSTASSIRPRGR